MVLFSKTLLFALNVAAIAASLFNQERKPSVWRQQLARLAKRMPNPDETTKIPPGVTYTYIDATTTIVIVGKTPSPLVSLTSTTSTSSTTQSSTKPTSITSLSTKPTSSVSLSTKPTSTVSLSSTGVSSTSLSSKPTSTTSLSNKTSLASSSTLVSSSSRSSSSSPATSHTPGPLELSSYSAGSDFIQYVTEIIATTCDDFELCTTTTFSVSTSSAI